MLGTNSKISVEKEDLKTLVKKTHYIYAINFSGSTIPLIDEYFFPLFFSKKEPLHVLSKNLYGGPNYCQVNLMS